MTDLLVRPEPSGTALKILATSTCPSRPASWRRAGDTKQKPAAMSWPSWCSEASARSELAGRVAAHRRAQVRIRRPSLHSYLSLKTSFTVMADSDCDLAFCYSRAEEEHPARLVTPDQVSIEIRGGGNATRQIHAMIPPEFPAHRLLVVEVFTPEGNWSSFPPTNTMSITLPRKWTSKRFTTTASNGQRALPSRRCTPLTAALTKRSQCATESLFWCRKAITRGGRARLQRLLPECAGGLGAFHGLFRRPRLCVGEKRMARERPSSADGEKITTGSLTHFRK